jgi:putative SOS response-associated peptidase YedK
MCGRFALNSTPRRIAAHFRLRSDQFELFPRYNIAPTQPVFIIRQSAHSLESEHTHVVWGLIPGWAKDVAIGNRMINARSESAAVKPGYRGAMRYRRCLVPVDGFYEWRKSDLPGVKKPAPKQPYFITHAGGDVFAFAGLWEHWQGPGGEEIESCTILTTTPNKLMEAIHDRMPVILSPDDYERWIDTTLQEPEQVTDLMKPCPPSWLTMRAVSTFVNSPHNEGERCVMPVEEVKDGLF